MIKKNNEVIQYKRVDLRSRNKRKTFLVWHEEIRLHILFLKTANGSVWIYATNIWALYFFPGSSVVQYPQGRCTVSKHIHRLCQKKPIFHNL